MKKIFAVMICILLVVSLCACGGATTQADENSQGSTISDQTSAITSADGSEEGAEWKQFLKDYEKWVDDYISLVEKYNANPTDITILNDYTKMAAEMADWSSRADDIQKELESSPEALAEYSKELSRIVAKLATVAN